MEFIDYYNAKYMREADIVAGCVFLGDVSGDP